jgi:hypothetical protein
MFLGILLEVGSFIVVALFVFVIIGWILGKISES